MGDYHACHDAINGMMARLGNMLGGHQGRLFNIGMVMAGDILATATPAICPAPKTT